MKKIIIVVVVILFVCAACLGILFLISRISPKPITLSDGTFEIELPSTFIENPDSKSDSNVLHAYMQKDKEMFATIYKLINTNKIDPTRFYKDNCEAIFNSWTGIIQKDGKFKVRPFGDFKTEYKKTSDSSKPFCYTIYNLEFTGTKEESKQLNINMTQEEILKVYVFQDYLLILNIATSGDGSETSRNFSQMQDISESFIIK